MDRRRGERRTARIAARHADGWNIPYVDPEGFQRKKAALEHWCTVEGRDPTTIRIAVQVGLYMAPEDDEGAVARLRERLAEQVGPQALQQPGWLVGGPTAVAEQLAAYREAGADWINLTVRPPVDFAALEAFVEHVMPAFR